MQMLGNPPKEICAQPGEAVMPNGGLPDPEQCKMQ